MTEQPAKPRVKRGAPINLPMWWIELMLTALRGKSDQTVVDTINGVSSGEAWDRPTMTKFRQNKHTTIELALAISAAFQLPPPVVFPTTKEEAEAIRLIQLEHAGRRERLLRAYRSPDDKGGPPPGIARVSAHILDDVSAEEMAEATARADARVRGSAESALIRRKRADGHERHTEADLVPIEPKKSRPK